MQSVSLNEMKSRLGAYWQELIMKNGNSMLHEEELRKVLEELNNSELEIGIFEIWMDLISQTLTDDKSPGTLKILLSSFICGEVKWWTWFSKNEERLRVFKLFIINLFKNKKHFGHLVWKFVFKYFDIAFVRYREAEGKGKKSNTILTKNTEELKNFENIAYKLGDKTFEEYRILRNFVDKMIAILDSELDKSKEQFISLPKTIRPYTLKLLKRLPQYNDQSTVYYGFKEKAEVNRSFFIDHNNKKLSKNFLCLSMNEAVDDLVIDQLCKCNKSVLKLLEFNTKMMKYVFQILEKCYESNSISLRASFKKFIQSTSLVHSNNYKIILTNLFILISRFPAFEVDLIDFIIDFLVQLDSELVSNKNNSNIASRIDFTLRICFTYLSMKMSGKKHLKNKDLFINYMIGNHKRKKSVMEVEDVFDRILNVFFDKIIKLEKTMLVQYLVVFIVSSGQKVLKNSNFDDFKQIFLHKAVSFLFNSNVSSKTKENAICYLFSFLEFVEVDQKSLYLILYYCQQLLNKITKKMMKRASSDFPKIKDYDDFQAKLNERQKINFLSCFNQGLFCKLFMFLSQVMNNLREEVEAEDFVDLVNLFETYFEKYSPYIEILLNQNQEFFKLCLKMDSCIKNPLLKEMLDDSVFYQKQKSNLIVLAGTKNNSCAPSPILKKPRLHHSPIKPIRQPQRASHQFNIDKHKVPFIRHSLYTSTLSIKSMLSKNDKSTNNDIWEFQLNLHPFKPVDDFFYQEFISDKIKKKKKLSLQDTDHSMFMTPILEKRNYMDSNHFNEF